jgi:hypothetical protein
MTAPHSVKLIPWDDREFVQAYERAATSLAAEGVALHQAAAPGKLQRLLRAEGYPDAICYCETTADSILSGRARCVVVRDGAPPTPLTHH